ncbi:AhpD-like protein [Scheffersomyces xylosifermentans]|uniref:AhpD-like protein n=1 Tax=Scheffersomyces xylosifermentans TaxID=1304137 RepID=UPI00315D8212
MSVLTADRLVKLAYNYPKLHNSWFLVACACLTVINQPQEIPKVFHFALRQQLLEFSTEKSLLTDPYLLRLAQDSISSSQKFMEFTAVGVNLPDVLIPYTYHDKLPLKYKFSKTEDIHSSQVGVAAKFREVILKSSALAGLPKAINALMVLKTVTPTSIRPSSLPERKPAVFPGHLSSSQIAGEDATGTRFEGDENSITTETIDGPISPSSINAKQIQSDLTRGSEFWNQIYTNKVNTRVKRQMYNAYPDLWIWAYQNVYSPLLSFTEILSAKETSMCIVASLIPQDVNPQLKGHLKGAHNLGVTLEELEEVRQLVFDLCDWTGGIQWKGGKEAVAKL